MISSIRAFWAGILAALLNHVLNFGLAIALSAAAPTLPFLSVLATVSLNPVTSPLCKFVVSGLIDRKSLWGAFLLSLPSTLLFAIYFEREGSLNGEKLAIIALTHFSTSAIIAAFRGGPVRLLYAIGVHFAISLATSYLGQMPGVAVAVACTLAVLVAKIRTPRLTAEHSRWRS
ncbi:hypothetical protein PQU94_04095 [Asticcacaulis sp. DXS10W]|uniref:Uncharacterized protein n=1 Tax=Asticcacaulis currens TaxID=2984210 RepID=A0ABT5IDD0_9CAUL|nr:hypothetical protein [Asticcacaulis currens]MDC7693461.1 hypothetical protein [Asticcacaulis currens]